RQAPALRHFAYDRTGLFGPSACAHGDPIDEAHAGGVECDFRNGPRASGSDVARDGNAVRGIIALHSWSLLPIPFFFARQDIRSPKGSSHPNEVSRNSVLVT